MKEKLLAFLFFTVLSAIFLGKFLVSGKVPIPGDLLVSFYAPWSAEYSLPSMGQGGDVIRQMYPWKNFTIESLKNGQIPLWNPYNFAGNPHLANVQSAVFYPLNLLFLVLGLPPGWMMLIFLQTTLSGFFLYLFLRIRKVTVWGSILGGISFAYSLFFMVWLEWNNVGHALLYLPLALYGIELLFTNRRKIITGFFILIVSFSLSMLAGHTQMSLYLIGISVLYFILRYFEDSRRNFKNILIFFGALVLSLGVASIQLLPTAEFYQSAARSSASASYIFERSLLPIRHLIATLIPDYFGNPARRNFTGFGTYIEEVSYFGVIPLFFALLAVAKKRKPVIYFFAGVSLISIILSLRSPISLWFYSLPIPVIGTSGPTRILSLFGFSGAVLAGFGVDCWQEEILKKKKLPIFSILLFGVIFSVLLGGEFLSKNSTAIRNSVLPAFSFFIVLALIILGRLTNISKKLLLFVLVAVTTIDLFVYGWRINPSVPPNLVFPQHPVFSELKNIGGVNRFFGVEDGYIDTNFSTYYKVFSPEGYDPLNIRRYGELISSSVDGKYHLDIPRSDVNLVKVDDVSKFDQLIYRRRLFQILGIKYIVDKNDNMSEKWFPEKDKFHPELFTLIWQTGKWKIYEYSEALPRAFLVNDYAVESKPEKIIERVYNKGFLPSKTVILEEALPRSEILDGNPTVSNISTAYYGGNSVVFNVKSAGKNLLFVSDNYYPGWEVYVDGVKSTIYRADYTFRAVVVPNGEHTVKFLYNPKSYSTGKFITLTTIAILAVIFLIYGKYGKKKIN